MECSTIFNMLAPPILLTSRVKLRLLQRSDIQPLLQAAQDEDVWRWFTVDLREADRMTEWVDQLLKDQRSGSRIPLVIEDLKTGKLAGSSSYMNIAEVDLCLEIGTTWIAKEYHGTGINYHMKLAMLRHAFEVWNFERVEFRTDALNVRSRRAIEKIGASYDGMFRNHRFNKEGGRRDSVIYSILKRDWPEVSERVFSKIS